MFSQELYEPFWADLYHFLSTHGIRIRSIWVPTTSSYNTLLNSSLIHDPVSAFDHTRDILHMVNHFRSSILQPILGIGHSIGASQLAMASVFHPTLFAGLVLLDPIFVPDAKTGMAERLARFAVRRPNEWKTRREAEGLTAVVWKDWDVRVRRAWNEYALEPVDVKEPMGRTRLTWGRDQEVSSYLQFGHVFPFVAEQGEEDTRIGNGKMPEWGNGKGVIFVKGPAQMWKFLPMMSSHTLILCGEKPGSAFSLFCLQFAARKIAARQCLGPTLFSRTCDYASQRSVSTLQSRSTELTDGDMFVIIACDGLWDVQFHKFNNMKSGRVGVE